MLGDSKKPMSQMAFAQIVDVPAGTLSRVEKGVSPLPLDAAQRIEATFGCSLEGLYEGKLMALNGLPYEPRHLAHAIESLPEVKDLDLMEEDIAFRCALLLRTLGRRGALYGATRLRQTILDILEECDKDGHDLDTAARVNSKVDAKTLTISQISKDTKLREFIAKDIKSFKPSQRVQLITESYRSWSVPESEFRPVSEKRFKHIIRAIMPDGTERRYERTSIEVVDAKKAPSR